jgi:hypothetical protein
MHSKFPSRINRSEATSSESSKVKITLPCKLLKTQGDFAWLGVRDGIRNWLLTAA